LAYNQKGEYMTKSIRSFPKKDQKAVAERRVAAKTGGLGYLGALDAQNARIRAEVVKTPAK
jgi:hypothetical protein